MVIEGVGGISVDAEGVYGWFVTLGAVLGIALSRWAGFTWSNGRNSCRQPISNVFVFEPFAAPCTGRRRVLVKASARRHIL